MRGSYWLTPEVVSTAGVEHGYIAKLAMLGIERGSPDAHRYVPMPRWHHPLDERTADVFLKRGVLPAAVAFLAQGKDARLWAMREWGWVRIRDGNFDLWKFDPKTLDVIRSAVDFWRDSGIDPEERVTVSEESTGDLFTIQAKRLLRRDADPDALKHHAMGVGTFRNPPEAVSACKVAAAFADAGYEVIDAYVQDDELHVVEGVGPGFSLKLKPAHASWRYEEWLRFARALRDQA